ncbi:YkvA family protein [Desulfoplanes sp. PS50]
MDIKSILNKIDKEFILSKAETIGNSDFGRVIRESETIQKLAAKDGPLQKFVSDVTLLLAMVKDYYTGAYRDIPFKSVAAIAFTLLYVLNPLDLIPDFLPGIGQLDDAAVLALCLKMIRDDLEKYQTFSTNTPERRP